MIWLVITIIAYLLNAIAAVFDKILLKKAIGNPFVYTFYITGLGGALAIFFLPLGFIWPGWQQFFLSMTAGIFFALGLIFLFWGLKKEEATRLMPIIGGLVPFFIFFMAFWLVGERLSARQIVALFFTIGATFILAFDFSEKGGLREWLKDKFYRRGNKLRPKLRRALWFGLPAAFLFAAHYALIKIAYESQGFITGFSLSRLGAFCAAGLLIFLPANYRDLSKKDEQREAPKTKILFLAGQSCGALSAVLVQYAVALASVTIVQALQGLQFVFLFLIAMLLSFVKPRLLAEKITPEAVTQKTSALLIMFFGVYLLLSSTVTD